MSERTGRRRTGVVLLTASLLCGLGPIWSSPARAAECTWTVDPVGRPRGFVWSIDARSVSDAWAVGSEPGPDPGDPYRPAIHHWDGASWTRTETPRQGTLTAVDAVAADDAWAVGFVGGRDRVVKQLYEHWDGARWTVVAPSEERRGVVEDVVAVASDDVWAVGWNRPGPMIRVWHWDGSSWSRAAAPRMPGRLQAVDVRNDHLVVAGFTASAQDPGDEVGLILRGPAPWRRVPIDGGTDQLGVLNAVSGSWVTGYRPGSNWTVHRTADGWTSIPFPDELEGGVDAVADLGSHDAWAFGRTIPGGVDASSTWGIFHWDGASWTTQPVPTGYEDAPGSLSDAAVVPGSASMFVVGSAELDAGSRPVVLRGVAPGC